MDISSTLSADASRVTTPISFDGQLSINARIQLENIQITDRACPLSRSFLLLQTPTMSAFFSLEPKISNANRSFRTPYFLLE